MQPPFNCIVTFFQYQEDYIDQEKFTLSIQKEEMRDKVIYDSLNEGIINGKHCNEFIN